VFLDFWLGPFFLILCAIWIVAIILGAIRM
jgi:hypothetical protein